MPAAGAAVPAVVEGAGQLEDLDEPPEPRVRGGSGRAGLMKPLVVLALPGMYLFYKYSQYRREQRELSRRRVTERELQHLHHKIVSEASACLLRMELAREIGPIGRLKSDRSGNYDHARANVSIYAMRTRWRYFRDSGAKIHVTLIRSRLGERKNERKGERIDGGWK